MTPLYGHVSQETAHLVDDYPYGSLRCQIRFWVERHPKRGFRFVSQTLNPKTLRWNNPKQGTYSLLAMAMFLDEKNHISHASLSEYSSVEDVLSFLKSFPQAPLSANLKLRAVVSRKMTERTTQGAHNFTIAGSPQTPNEADIEKAKAELVKWDEVIGILKAGKTPEQEK